MRTDRRQDLKTNELSHQIDAVRDYAKKNATMLTVIVVGAAVVVGAGLAYAKWQNDQRMEAWDAVASVSPTTDAVRAIENLQAVAARNVTPGVTEAALLKVAETAMRQNILPPAETKDSPAAAAPAKPVDWAAKAREAYQEIQDRFPKDKIAVGQATIALGVLAEDKGEMDKARELYKKVAENKELLHTSLIAQADYRLAHLDQWSKPVVFPQPQMTVPVPEEEPKASQSAKGMASIQPVTRAPAGAPPIPVQPESANPPAEGAKAPPSPPPAAPAAPTPGQGASQ